MNIIVPIAILVILAIVFVVSVHWYLYKNYHYLCPKCSNTFKPNTFLKSMFGLNLFHKRGLRCTKCDTFVSARTKRDPIT